MKDKKKPAVPASVPVVSPDRIYWWILGITLAMVLYTRLALLGIPLERDEGGFAYIGQHLLGSQLLYTDVFDNKLPGLYLMYWVFNLLPGSQGANIHLGLLLVQAGTLALFFPWMRKMFDLPVAAISTSLFAVSALMPGVFGFAAHATQLMMLPVVGGLRLLWDFTRAPESDGRWWRLAVSGLLLGFAFTVKQPAVVFIVFAEAVLLLGNGVWLQKMWRALVLGLASLAPFGICAGYFWMQGRFNDFWLWTYTMPTVQTVSADDSLFYLNKLIPRMVGNHWLFWGLGVLSLGVIPFTEISRSEKAWVAGLLVLSMLSSIIGLGFIPHYFVPVIPWAALGIAICLNWLTTRRGNNWLAPLASGLIFIPVLMNAGYFFKPDYARIMEDSYPWNGFSEAKAVATELKKRLKPGERIAVLGSEPQLCYYTATERCSPHLFMYPVVREHKLKQSFQQQFLRDLADCQAEYVVLTASEASWAPGFAETPFFKRDIFPKITAGYDLIGRANIGQIPLNIVWDEALKTHNPPKCPPMFVFKRKQAAVQQGQ